MNNRDFEATYFLLGIAWGMMIMFWMQIIVRAVMG